MRSLNGLSTTEEDGDGIGPYKIPSEPTPLFLSHKAEIAEAESDIRTSAGSTTR